MKTVRRAACETIACHFLRQRWLAPVEVRPKFVGTDAAFTAAARLPAQHGDLLLFLKIRHAANPSFVRLCQTTLA